MIDEVLKSIGLSRNETKIYLALLELGPSLMGQISGKTKIHRRNIYDSVEMLKDKGFISSTLINNRNVFEAVNPERIIDMLDERKTDIEAILPALIGRQDKKQVNVRIYTGTKGRKIIFEDKLKQENNEEQYVLGAHKPSDNRSAYIKNFHNRRIKKKIPLRMLFTVREKEFAIEFSNYKYVIVRMLPEKFKSPIAINIYADKTAIFLGSEAIEPISILIQDKQLSDDFRLYFKMLWGISSPLKGKKRKLIKRKRKKT